MTGSLVHSPVRKSRRKLRRFRATVMSFHAHTKCVDAVSLPSLGRSKRRWTSAPGRSCRWKCNRRTAYFGREGTADERQLSKHPFSKPDLPQSASSDQGKNMLFPIHPISFGAAQTPLRAPRGFSLLKTLRPPHLSGRSADGLAQLEQIWNNAPHEPYPHIRPRRA